MTTEHMELQRRHETLSTEALAAEYNFFRQNLPPHLKFTVSFYLDPEHKDIKERLDQQINSELFFINPPTTLEAFIDRYLPSDTPRDVAIEAFHQLSKEVGRANRLIYWHFTLEKAIQLINQQVSGLTELCEELKTKVSFLDVEGGENDDDFEDAVYAGGPLGSTGSRYLITVPKLKDYTHIGKHQLLRIVYFAHEFFHVVNSYHITKNFGPDDGNSSNDHLKHSVRHVLLEATSLALEAKIFESPDNTPQNEQLEVLERYRSWRKEYVMGTSKYRHQANRTNFIAYINGDGETDESSETKPMAEFGQLNYIEGARLAKALSRRGWTLDNLPELWEKVKIIYDQLTNEYRQRNPLGGNPRFNIYTTLIHSYDPQRSLWMEIRRRLMREKPST